jgi:hypothetical protein
MRPRRGEGYCCASAVDGNAGIDILQAIDFEVAQAAQRDAVFRSIADSPATLLIATWRRVVRSIPAARGSCGRLAGSLPPLNET